MTKAVRKYLARLDNSLQRPFYCSDTRNIAQAVVIPVLGELDYLPDTLKTLAGNPESECQKTLVICVINNRRPAQANSEHLEQNRLLLTQLANGWQGLRLGVIDASSPGNELPDKDGVGLARKLGMDKALEILVSQNSAPTPLLSLDADTRVDPNYLQVVRTHLEQSDSWAAVINYAHPLDGPEYDAIIAYELYLRYHELGLRFAGSPYAYPAIGSTMACTTEAYAAVSGMNRRQGGEDFYFLQKLAKTGPVAHINATTVHPSARPSNRVPFGTGPRIQRYLDGTHDEYCVYHPECYRILRDWLNAVAATPNATATQLLHEARTIRPVLCDFLEANNFAVVWERLQHNAADNATLVQSFHHWFDALRTLRLIHHLRDHGFPEVDIIKAVKKLVTWQGILLPAKTPESVLQTLRSNKLPPRPGRRSQS